MSINAHPELPEFDYIRPASVMEASRFLAQHPGTARPLAGGTDIFVRMRDGIWHDQYLVDLKGLDGLNTIHFDPGAGLVIGAAVNMNRVAAHPAVQQHYPILVEACDSVASYQLRTRATIGGNICNASPAGDTIGACLVLGASLIIHGVNGQRQEPLAGFFTGPGKNRLQAGDIVSAIHLPLPPAGMAGTYLKLGRNAHSDLSIVGVAAVGFADPQAPSGYRFRLALASVAPTPLLVGAVEQALAQAAINAQAIAQAASLAEAACNPISDVRSSDRYRRQMVRSLSLKALRTIWMKLQAGNTSIGGQ